MTRMRAMIVSLTTDHADESNTDEQLYVGLWGTSGGREFPLASKHFAPDNFAKGSTRVFLLGSFSGVVTPPEGRQSDRAAKGEANDPGLFEIELDQVQYVYLRKQASGDTIDDDDAYRLLRISVDLFGTAGTPPNTSNTAKTPERRFVLDTRGLWFGYEHGQQAWLKEVELPPPG